MRDGIGQRQVGVRGKGVRVGIVDDVCTDGASTVQAIAAGREFGFEIVGVICLVEREEAKGRPSVEKAAAGVPFISIFTAGGVRNEDNRQMGEKETVDVWGAAQCVIYGRAVGTYRSAGLGVGRSKHKSVNSG